MRYDTVKHLVMWRENFTCSRCGRQFPDVDIEVIPLEKSGSPTSENMQVVCVDCNRVPRRQYQARLPLPEYYEALKRELV